MEVSPQRHERITNDSSRLRWFSISCNEVFQSESGEADMSSMNEVGDISLDGFDGMSIESHSLELVPDLNSWGILLSMAIQSIF